MRYSCEIHLWEYNDNSADLITRSVSLNKFKAQLSF